MYTKDEQKKGIGCPAVRSLVRDGRGRQSLLAGGRGVVLAAGRELRRPRRVARDVDVPAAVDDDDLAVATTLVHHRAARVVGRGGGRGGHRGVLQAGRARVQQHRQQR